jgi:hypothetical protein
VRAATGPHSAVGLADLEDANVAALCRQGIRFALATQPQLDALAAAQKPVYDTLATDPAPPLSWTEFGRSSSREDSVPA